MKAYTPNTIIALSQFMLGDEDAGEWLVKHDCKELTWLASFIMNRDSNNTAYSALIENEHYQLAAFIDALLGDNDAFKYLLNSDHKVWAATANAFNEDHEAMEWLKKTGNTHFARLAGVIVQKWQEYDMRRFHKKL